MTISAMLAGVLLTANTVVLAAAPTSVVKPPSKTFFTNSWNKMSKTDRYSLNCVSWAGPAQATEALSPEIQKNFDLIQEALALYNGSEKTVFIGPEKKLDSHSARTNSMAPVVANILGQISYDEALQGARSSVRKELRIHLNKDAFYFAPTPDVWKSFKEKNLTEEIYKSIKKNSLTVGYDKASLKFREWIAGDQPKSRHAVYTGRFTKEGTDGLITGSIGEAFVGGSGPADTKIFIDEKTGEWRKSEITVSMQLGAIAFPVKKVCSLALGKSVNAATPANATDMDARAGLQEFSQLYQSLLQ